MRFGSSARAIVLIRIGLFLWRRLITRNRMVRHNAQVSEVSENTEPIDKNTLLNLLKRKRTPSDRSTVASNGIRDFPGSTPSAVNFALRQRVHFALESSHRVETGAGDRQKHDVLGRRRHGCRNLALTGFERVSRTI